MIRKLSLATILLLLVLTPFAPALAQTGSVTVSAYGGWAFPVAGDAIKGKDGDSGPQSSSFDSDWTMGAEVTYRFSSGFSLGLGLGYLSLDAKASRAAGGNEADWAKLKLTPLYLLLKYDHSVAEKIRWYGEAGVAYTFTDVEEGDSMKAMGRAMGGSAKASVSDAAMFMIGTGVNYDLAPSWTLNLGARYWLGEFDTDLEVNGVGLVSKNKFDAQNAQILLGVSYWFNL